MFCASGNIVKSFTCVTDFTLFFYFELLEFPELTVELGERPGAFVVGKSDRC
jgi:hypothetical protein